MSIKINHDPNKIFFTSDQHFGHRNFLVKEFGERHILYGHDVDAMNKDLIRRWNEKVPADGLTFFLGDIGFMASDDLKRIIDQLNGDICFIRGDHDKTAMHSKYRWVKDYAHVKIAGQDIILQHAPAYTWSKCHSGSWMLCGHEHGNINHHEHMQKWKIMDVGVDCNENYEPFSFNEIKAIMDTRLPIPHHSR